MWSDLITSVKGNSKRAQHQAQIQNPVKISTLTQKSTSSSEAQTYQHAKLLLKFDFSFADNHKTMALGRWIDKRATQHHNISPALLGSIIKMSSTTFKIQVYTVSVCNITTRQFTTRRYKDKPLQGWEQCHHSVHMMIATLRPKGRPAT